MSHHAALVCALGTSNNAAHVSSDSTSTLPASGSAYDPFAVTSGSNLVLAKFLMLPISATCSALTYGSQSMTFGQAFTDGTTNRFELWYLIAPAVGTASFTPTWTGGFTGGAYPSFSILLSGVAQSSPLVNTGSLNLSGSATINDGFPSRTPGGIIVDMVVNVSTQNGATAPDVTDSTQTQRQTSTYTNRTARLYTKQYSAGVGPLLTFNLTGNSSDFHIAGILGQFVSA